MGKPLTIIRTDRTSGELRALAAKCPDGAQVRRLLALAMVLDGAPRTEAAACSGMDRQTLRDWVHRYNEGGVDALKSQKNPGRTPYLTKTQMAELRQVVGDGADLATDQVVRWRIADLHGVEKRRFSVDAHPSTVGKWLHQLRLTRLQPRPVHPKKDPEAETAFKKRARIGGPPVAVETDLVEGSGRKPVGSPSSIANRLRFASGPVQSYRDAHPDHCPANSAPAHTA